VSTDDPRDPDIDAAYRVTPRDDPPRALDERILAAAHRAVAARPASIGRSFAQRWRVPVALAATVVLSATVTLMVYESDRAPPVLEELRSDKTRSNETQSDKTNPEKARVDRGASAGAPARSSPEQESGARESKPLELRESGRIESQSQPRAPVDEDLRRQAQEPKSERALSNEAKGAAAPFAAEPPRPAAAPPAPAESRAPIAPRAKDAEQPLAKKRAAPSAPQPEGSLGTLRERALADRPVDRAERDSGTGVADSALRTPEDWVAEIRRVKQAGRNDEANRLLTELRVRFPDYVLPEDLR
jgi:resuscitation-promoting factor RpfA